MAHISEYDVENLFIDRLESITKMTGAIKEFVVNTYSRYKAEGE